MGIISSAGASSTTSSRERPESLRPELQDKVPVLDEQALLGEKVVRQSFLNNTAINSDAFKNDMSLIAGYPEGRIIYVTYFSQNTPNADIQTHLADLNTPTKDDVHISWVEIRNFELRLQSPFNYSYEKDKNISTFTSDALVLPGFIPRIGDNFLYEVRNGKIGIFTISSIERVSIGQDSYHRIQFSMQEYLTPETRDRFGRQTIASYYFDKTKFLAGNHSFLTSAKYIDKKELTHLRKEIIQNYMDRFYDPEYSSFVRKDGIYDPYVIEYWNKRVSYRDCNTRPTQLLISVSNYAKTIWGALTNNPIKDLRNVARHWSTETMRATFWSVNVTALLGRKFLTVGDEVGGRVWPTWADRQGPEVIHDGAPFYQPIPMNDSVRHRADALMHSLCEWYYDGHMPKCHPKHPEHRHPSTPHNPPYPVLSDDELFAIWMKLHQVDPTKEMTNSELARARGYVDWYRDTYSGTLTMAELERQWRQKHQLKDVPLTAEQRVALEQYVKDYRAQYPAVLADRQIEQIWRNKHHIELGVSLDEEQIKRLTAHITRYRREHGPVPTDVPIADTSPLGTPFDTSTPTVEPDTSIPSIFLPHVHPINPCLHDVHDHCHCPPARPIVPPPQEDTTSYALSNEFYLGSTAMDPFEQLVYDTLTCREVHSGKVVDAVSRYLEWDDEDAFYRHLLSLYLIDRALYWLTHHG